MNDCGEFEVPSPVCRRAGKYQPVLIFSAYLSIVIYRSDFGTKYAGVCARAAGAEFTRIEGSYEKLRTVPVSL
jgi:hypothetical protein